MSSDLPFSDLPRAELPASLRARIAERVAASTDPLARLRAGSALELYYEAGDAHSQLCAGLARRLLPRLRVPLRVHLVPAPEASTYPEAQRQRRFAQLDAGRLAPCHALAAPLALDDAQRAALEARLAAVPDAAQRLAVEAQILDALRAGAALPPTAQTAAQPQLAEGAQRRARLGHYLPAMWQYRGQWYWALDRLELLEQALRADGALDGEAPLARCDTSALPVPEPSAGAPLEFWFSFRSPYSYLAAVALLRRRAAGQQHPLQVRPVLPMVMRGLPVPRAKRLYIVRDTYRCARQQMIPFGRIHDPVGEGVLRLLTVYPQEADAQTQLRYCAVAGQTVWAEGLDVRRDAVLRSVLERCGLDWSRARARLDAGFDTAHAETHREALFAAGLWGVPSFRVGEFVTWGQDRLWMVDRVLGAEDRPGAAHGPD